MRSFVIHKPTHVFSFPEGAAFRVIGQRRGDSVRLNVRDRNGALTLKTWAVGSCADHLTGYGSGVSANEPSAVQRMRQAWRFAFGFSVPEPLACEVVASQSRGK